METWESLKEMSLNWGIFFQNQNLKTLVSRPKLITNGETASTIIKHHVPISTQP
jgi:hypothetical protein